MNKIIKQFMAECVFEQRGELGLEGFQFGEKYRAEKVQGESGKKWFRIYPDEGFPDYYETCSEIGFNRYFKEEK